MDAEATVQLRSPPAACTAAPYRMLCGRPPLFGAAVLFCSPSRRHWFEPRRPLVPALIHASLALVLTRRRLIRHSAQYVVSRFFAFTIRSLQRHFQDCPTAGAPALPLFV
jgi:hypothetical protein